MEDAISQCSVDSAADEFVVIDAEPKLRVANDGDPRDLEAKLSEVLNDENSIGQASNLKAADQKKNKQRMASANSETKEISLEESPLGQEDVKTDFGFSGNSLQPEDQIQDEDNEITVFTGVTYLGSASVNAPRSEIEITRNMIILNGQSQMAIPIILSVPSNSEGIVHLLDPVSNTDIADYRIHRILFCARGATDTSESNCFAFTCSHGDCPETAIFQCHVFRCDVHEAVGKILYSFATAFRRVPKSPVPEVTVPDHNVFRFNVTLDVKEDDGKGGYSTCPKDRNVFKLRCDLEKKVVITVSQLTMQRELKIERCFGLLVSAGRNVKHSEMHLIDMVSMGASGDGKSYVICGQWDPTNPHFKYLNTETQKDTRVFMTLAVDLVIEGIQEPVRFLIETKAKIYPTNERFWYFTKKPHNEQFILKLKECEEQEKDSETQYEVVGLDSQTEIERKKQSMMLTLSPAKKVPLQNIQTPQDPDEENSDNEEPLLSGSGYVSKEVTDENLLENWHEALTKWHQNLKQRPKQGQMLVRKGIPEALRGEVWQLLVGCTNNSEMLEAYRILQTKDSPCEQVISRDINRTFPAHDYFREAGGVGQDSLFKISKAYSVYDEEIGYCQGLSFLAAALLLHMPEEQAFCVLVKVMFDYGLRDLFKQGFEELHLNFYQLERLMQDQLPELFNHFMEQGLEAHMYASQWFLTLFTAKFPLYMVFHILDIYLCEGKDTIFSVALALLKTSSKALLKLDFEGVLKYFRVSLPKKYRNEECSKELMQVAISLKVNPKKLKKYEKEYLAMKEQQIQQEDPVERYERENQRLLDANMRLEQENDDLAHELVTSKIALRNDLDTAEDRAEILQKELQQTKALLVDTEEEKSRLIEESSQVKEMCRRELEKGELESTRNHAIIQDYKQICSQLSERLEKQQSAAKEEMCRIKMAIQPCIDCGKLVSPDGDFRNLESMQTEADLDPQLIEKERLIRELELELAQTKLALVESECKTQDLTHQLNTAVMEIQASKNTWFQKTLSSIKEATVKKEKLEGKERELVRKESLGKE